MSGESSEVASPDQVSSPPRGIVRTNDAAHTCFVSGAAPVSWASGIAASTVQVDSSAAAATNHVGFQVASFQQASCVQPRWSTASSYAVV